MYKIGLIRSTSYKVKNNLYNVQEIGLAKELSKLGMEVDVYIFSNTGKTYIEKFSEYNKVTVYWLRGIEIPGRQAFYKELNFFLDKNEYDLIWALDDSQLTTVLTSIYCRRKKIKFVLWQGMYENYSEKIKRIIQLFFDFTFLKILRKNTKYTISKTTSAQNYLLMKKFPKGVVIPVGLELSNFEKYKKINYRKKLNIDNQKKILLYVGKIEERRKPIFCMELFKNIKKDYDNVCLVYVGNGPMQDAVHEYVDRECIRDVYFFDKINQNELPSLYEESDLFILPTSYEIFGMVLMEAMYFGTPVITYKAAGPIDVIDNNVDGFIMNNFNVEEWKNTILNYLELSDSKDMKKKCIAKIEKSYLWNKVAKDYYDEIVRIIEL